MAIKAIEVGRAPRLCYLRPGAAHDNQTPLRPRRAYNGPAHYVRGAIVVCRRRRRHPARARPPLARARPPARAALQRTLGVSPRAIVVKSEIEKPIVLKSQTNWPIVLGHALHCSRSIVRTHWNYNYCGCRSSEVTWLNSWKIPIFPKVEIDLASCFLLFFPMFI